MNKTKVPYKKFNEFVYLFCFLLCAIVSFMLGYYGLSDLYQETATVYFDKIFVFSLIASLGFLLLCILGISGFIHGGSPPLKFRNVILFILVILIFLATLSLPISNYYFTSMLKDKGYVMCPRNPGQSFIAGGRTWAKSHELCKKNAIQRAEKARKAVVSER